jgi:hypothetical protein
VDGVTHNVRMQVEGGYVQTYATGAGALLLDLNGTAQDGVLKLDVRDAKALRRLLDAAIADAESVVA